MYNQAGAWGQQGHFPDGEDLAWRAVALWVTELKSVGGQQGPSSERAEGPIQKVAESSQEEVHGGSGLEANSTASDCYYRKSKYTGHTVTLNVLALIFGETVPKFLAQDLIFLYCMFIYHWS